MSNPEEPLNTPVPHAGDEEPMGTVSAFKLTALREHLNGKHAGDLETCTETDCVQAREMLEGKS